MNEQVIIVPVHNQLSYVQKCIGSIVDNTLDAKIIIVDDGSDFDTAEWINFQTSLVNIFSIRNETAQGFSAACNKGIQYALDNFDFNCLCLLNSDAEVVTENWFDKVEDYFIHGDNVGVASVMSDNAMAQTIKNIPEYLKTIDSKPAVLTPLCHGFSYFISKKLIESVGLLDDKLFPGYGSEDDYSLKSLKAGFNNIMIGSVFVKHKGEASYSSAVRSKFVKKTLPLLMQKWGSRYVANCVKKYNDCGTYLNNI